MVDVKYINRLVWTFIVIAACFTAHAIEPTWDYAVQVSATVDSASPRISLSWPQDTTSSVSSYTVYRKALGDTSWGSAVNLPGSATSYVDSNVAAGGAYEYQIVKVTSSYNGYGYIYAGINAPLVENRGKLVLVVDDAVSSPLGAELSTLTKDLIGDGWTVIRRDVSRTATPPTVKAVIKAEFNADPSNVKAVFLFGHVPVPYSGNIVPDGHYPDHQGAWPADVYYGDMDGSWTDTSVYNTGAYDARNRNIPGDGKFDQSELPSPVELQVGRVDLANMPGRLVWGGPATFPSELELLRNYLRKDHNFRNKIIDAPRRAIVWDGFGTRGGEAFAGSAYRNFAPFFGANNISTLQNAGTWINSLRSDNYLWAYACGAGSFASVGGMGTSGQYNDGTTTDLVGADTKAFFTMLMGSWLGDWDSEDNIMRGVLATASEGLTCSWSGRPHWFYHHMGLGMNIGYAAKLTQNNGGNGLYRNQINSAAGSIHVALMGDPTLRMHTVAPVTNLRITAANGITLAWGASPDNVVGYHVYSAPNLAGPYTRLTSSPVTGTTFNHSGGTASTVYMVRAVKLETSGSGTYYNASQGVFASVSGGTAINDGSTVTSTPNSNPGTTPVGNTTNPSTSGWVDDAIPTGATSGGDGGDTWNWVSSNPAPKSGQLAHQSSIASGLHLHYFDWAQSTLTVNAGESLFAYVYLDAANPPSELMFEFNNGTWEHRAYWGANNIDNGVNSTASRRYMGALPAAGQWVKLEIPASQIGVEGTPLKGVSFSLYGGRATFDIITKGAAGSGGVTQPPVTATNSSSSSTNINLAGTLWVDEALPAGAVSGSDGGDTWNWISSNPTPISGQKAHQSAIVSGLHIHYFDWAQNTLPVSTGESLYTYIYLDPANPPSEVMLEFNNGTWEHRAYWGANSINNGANDSASRRYMGALPAAGRWMRLEVPASQLGLEGSVLRGVSFGLYDGRATFDALGKSPSSTGGTVSNPPTTTNVPPTTTTNTPPVATTNLAGTLWIDDALPIGASSGSSGGDSWAWVTSPAPASGQKAHQSAIAAGLHQHYFDWAQNTLTVNAGDILYTYVYLDSANPPTEVMLEFNDGTWEHRAYWGANSINNGVAGTASRRYIGNLPAAGQWVKLEVSASQLGLEGSVLRGMSFSLYNGRATFDATGKSAAGSTPVVNPPVTSTNQPSTGTNVTLTGVLWVDEALPSGAVNGGDGGDTWSWVSTPAPLSGKVAHQSGTSAGLHLHYFDWATGTLTVNSGESLYTYIYLDPANPPSEAMLEFNNGTWEHRAYWGANNIPNGADGTAGRLYMGPLPAAGKWARLEVPANAVALEGSTLKGMSFSLYGGRATWDAMGKTYPGAGTATPPATGTTNGLPGTLTNTVPGTVTNTVPGTTTPSGPVIGIVTNASPLGPSPDALSLTMPSPGYSALRILSPTLLELEYVNEKLADPAPVSSWNFVDSSFNLAAPAASEFTVSAGGQTIGVQTVGFKRRPLYAPLVTHDLRVDNLLYLKLASPIADNKAVEVKNASGKLWTSATTFTNNTSALRMSPAIHVNQEGYMPNFSKKAMVGYYLGNLGEMDIPAGNGFQLVDAASGQTVFTGSLTIRPDVGYVYAPKPYQKVYTADFTSFNTPGKYRLVVPGLGASMPFLINDGIAMDFARTYALGLYHQRCGTSNSLPYTRHTHDACHVGMVDVPSPQSSFGTTWTILAGKTTDYNANPLATAPRMQSEASMLFPFVNKGKIDASGGHHDAGDYSKYTINSAGLIHYLMTAVDSFPGVAALDNLGIPESGDGISDLLQEAKWEADYLAKIQDADGGFYFLVYPKEREYESNVTPDKGDSQVVWPKNTAVTASGVAALAQCASSPAMKKAYPQAAALYMQKAQLGWQFLTNAIARYGKNGSYQKITHYGNEFMHDDELAWAAAEMFLATGNPVYQQTLMAWFDPSNPATWRWGWWRMFEGFGRAARSYAFAVRSGRLAANQVDAAYLANCEQQAVLCAQDHVTRANQNAYGTSFPIETKAVRGAGWYFSSERAFDISVGYQISPKPEFLDAIIANLNYEGGCNPVNVSYVTGLGWKRQREIVHQYAQNDRRILPPGGIPLGNVQDGFAYVGTYKTELANLCFPYDNSTAAPYPYYDRWGDSFNVSTEFVNLDQARSLASLSFVATLTPLKPQAWKPVAGTIVLTPQDANNTKVTAKLQAPGMDLSGARIVWETRDQEPAYGDSFVITPKSNGPYWVEAEAQWPDGRRVVAATSFVSANPVVTWVDDSIPAGATPGSLGGDTWSWISASPSPISGSAAHQSAAVAGEHQHWFDNASSTMDIKTGDTMFAYVYLDPANPPTEVMLQWNDGTWEHRAYWGANSINYGNNNSGSRRYMGGLPAAGKWVRLEVPAAQVDLEGKTVKGLSFTLYGGRAFWDASGKTSPTGTTGPVNVTSTVSLNNGVATVSWGSTVGAVYQVYYATAIADNNWQTLGSPVIATGPTMSVADSAASGATSSARYYKVSP
ncbi:MAG: hypothetical protein JWM16_2619, partial [Verrucomicrobiales bacterium]|nr:hypothetical protein [Verrucomicrobiales bacterium]